jgi:hypothetical protein
VLKSSVLKMVLLNQSKVDRAECTSSLEEEHPTSSQSNHQDREQLRQELLGKVCFSSRVVQKPPAKTKKKSSKEATAAVEGVETDELHSHHDAADAKPHRTCRSKHSQRRAAKWRSQQQHQ